MSSGPKEILEVRTEILRVKNTAASVHHARKKATLKSHSLAFKERATEMDSSEPNNLKDSPQTGMIQPEAECGLRRGVRDKSLCFMSGPKQNPFPSKIQRNSEYTENMVLLLKQFVCYLDTVSLQTCLKSPLITNTQRRQAPSWCKCRDRKRAAPEPSPEQALAYLLI